MNAGVETRLALKGDLHEAIDSGALHVVYQPQFDLVTGAMCGVEALARWNHPTLGPIAPDTSIPPAEESGLIIALDDWVMRTACAQLRAWTDAGLPPVRMAVNLSGRAFWRSRIVERVTDVLAATGIDPALLELEVTESMAVDAMATAPNGLGRPLFRELEALGVRLAIDDFGTGYSALGRLQGLPFHTLKIDRSGGRCRRLRSKRCCSRSPCWPPSENPETSAGLPQNRPSRSLVNSGLDRARLWTERLWRNPLLGNGSAAEPPPRTNWI